MNAAPPTEQLRGRVKRLRPGRNRGTYFGFIEQEGGAERFFFHADDVATDDKANIRSGSPVSFKILDGVKLPGEQYRRATNVQILRAQAA